jgi:hypothetical protein
MPPRSRNLFDPTSDKPFKLSRSKLELFMSCPRCFYIDRRLGVGRVSGPAFTLNTAVDCLLKKEFDTHRAHGEPHPLMRQYGLDAVPFPHPNLDQWRENFVGVQYHHAATNFVVFGAVDDLWVTPDGQLIVVDYKSTSIDGEVTLDGEWKGAYKRQMEVYQWLLRRKGFVVENRGYFVYVNGRKDREAFDGRLEFDVQLLPYDGSDDWVEEAVQYAHDCLMDDEIPDIAEDCEWCDYIESVVTTTRSP